MMPHSEIYKIVFAEPFRPFRIHMASGKSYDIRHPEVVEMARTHLTIFTPLLDDVDERDPMWQKISLMLVESLEPLETQSAAESR